MVITKEKLRKMLDEVKAMKPKRLRQLEKKYSKENKIRMKQNLKDLKKEQHLEFLKEQFIDKLMKRLPHKVIKNEPSIEVKKRKVKIKWRTRKT